MNPNAVDEAERQRAETFLKHAVDEASYLGARGMKGTNVAGFNTAFVS